MKEKIKHYTKVTSSWFVIHTELRCTVNHICDLHNHLWNGRPEDWTGREENADMCGCEVIDTGLGYSHWLPVLKRRILPTEGFCCIELTRWPSFTTGGFANISEDQKASVLIPRKPQRPVDFLRKSTAICPGLVHFHVSWTTLQEPWHWSGLNTHTHTHTQTFSAALMSSGLSRVLLLIL